LAGGIGDARAGAAEELESGDLAELVVERVRGSFCELFGGKNTNAGGGGFLRKIGTSGADDYVLHDGGGRELDFGVGAGIEVRGLWGEAGNLDADVGGGGVGREVEVAGGIGGGAQGARRFGQENDGAGNGTLLGIDYMGGEARVRGLGEQGTRGEDQAQKCGLTAEEHSVSNLIRRGHRI